MHSSPYLQYLILFAWALLGISFTLSPALISISFLILCIPGLLTLKNARLSNAEKTIFALFILYYFSTLYSGFYSVNNSETIRKLVLKLPILCFPLVYLSCKLSTTGTRIKMLQIFLFCMYLPAVVSVYNYFINKTLFDQLILESKPLPIEFGYGIYHIQFSILMAASLILAIAALIHRKTLNILPLDSYLIMFLALVNFVCLHILSARTGLLSLYAGFFTILILELRKLPLKLRIAGLSAFILIPLFMVTLSSSLKNRINNSVEDLKVVWQGKNANEYSFALRVQAWKNAIDLIKKHPLKGCGIGDAETELKLNYEKLNPAIEEKNRKNPHFQFLESSVQSGLISGLLFLAILHMIILRWNKISAFSASMAVLMLVASCFESILERQASVVGFTVLLAYIMTLFPNLDQGKRT